MAHNRRKPAAPKLSASSRMLVSDALWKRIKSLLPKRPKRNPARGGRPPVPDRKAMNAILFVTRTGCQWKALDVVKSPVLCSGSTAHLRFQAWTKAGVFRKLWARGLKEYDELKGLNWEWQSMDGAMTKAPLGGEKNRAQSDGSRQTRCQAQRVM